MRNWLVQRIRGPAWEEWKSPREQEGWAAHVDFVNALYADGCAEGTGDDTLIAVRAQSQAEIVARLAADPWTRSGHLVTQRISPWNPLADPPGIDVTEGSEQRFKLGVERFLTQTHGSIGYHGVALYKDPDGVLTIGSFADGETSSPEEAAAKIERSKEVFRDLCERSAELAAAVEPMKKVYLFGDNRMEVRLAWLEDGKLVWRGLKGP